MGGCNPRRWASGESPSELVSKVAHSLVPFGGLSVERWILRDVSCGMVGDSVVGSVTHSLTTDFSAEEVMRGFKGMKKLVVGKAAGRLARNISKEDFLAQLKEAWRPHVRKNTPIEDEVKSAMQRIQGSVFASAFKTVGVTEDDIRTLLEEIRSEKPEPVTVEPRVGRNDPCPCGSGNKYKRCCGK